MRKAEQMVESLVREADDAWQALEQLESQLDRVIETAKEAVQYTSTTPEERSLNKALKDVSSTLAAAKRFFDKAKSLASDFEQ